MAQRLNMKNTGSRVTPSSDMWDLITQVKGSKELNTRLFI